MDFWNFHEKLLKKNKKISITKNKYENHNSEHYRHKSLFRDF
jgi:hypothetical protein